MKLKTTELQGSALDWAVAKCEGQVSDSARFMAIFTHQNKTKQGFCWSTDWAQGGPIIEREGISLTYETGDWTASIEGHFMKYFDYSPLVAAMRAFVASKLGDEVEVHDELAA